MFKPIPTTILRRLKSVVKWLNGNKSSGKELRLQNVTLIYLRPAIQKSIRSITLPPMVFPTPSSNTSAICKRGTLWLAPWTGQQFFMISQFDRKTSFPYRHDRNPNYCHSNMCGTNRVSITIAWPILMLSFKTQLEFGLFLPVVILPQSELSSSIARQSIWSGQPLEKLLDQILKYTQATIPVQDHSMPSLDNFTITKTCEEVRARFHIRPEDRGCPWNCVDIKDWLFGFKGPKPLENGANLQNWQLHKPDNTAKSLSAFEPIQGAKLLDEWLLVSEKNSGWTAHVDVGYATWVSCLAGKKTFWVRNPSIDDLPVWLNFDIGDDHRAFVEPWARIDL